MVDKKRAVQLEVKIEQKDIEIKEKDAKIEQLLKVKVKRPSLGFYRSRFK